MNSTISARTPENRKKSKDTEKPDNRLRSPLTQMTKKENMRQAYADLLEILRFFFLPGLGCAHCRSEWGLFSGDFKFFPEIMLPCGSDCFVCDKSYEKYMLPIILSGAMQFLSSGSFGDQLPFEVTNENAEDLVDILWNSADNKKLVFGRKNIEKYRFFFPSTHCNRNNVI